MQNLDGYPGIDDAFEVAKAKLTNLSRPWEDPAARDLDRLSVAQWAYGTEADASTIGRFFRDVEGEFMVPATELSMAAATIASAVTNNDRKFRFRDGTAVLTEAMAAEVGPNSIRLKDPVLSVGQAQDGTSVVTRHGQYSFDALILAAPLPALQHIAMPPEFRIPWVGQGRGGKLLVPYENQVPVVEASSSPWYTN